MENAILYWVERANDDIPRTSGNWRELGIPREKTVNIGAFSALYFVLVFGLGFLGILGPIFCFIAWAISIIVSSPVIMLLLAKTQSMGTITILDSCTRAAQSVGISHLLHPPSTAPREENCRKSACASALAAQVDVIFFDEPTSNLSPQAIEEFADILRSLKEQGKCVLIAEHRLYFLRGIADRVLLMEEGPLAWDVPAEQFYAMDEAERRARGLRSLTSPNVPLLHARDAWGAQRDVEALGERCPVGEGRIVRD